MGLYNTTSQQGVFVQTEAPTSPSAGQLWSDTNANITYRRNDANSTWVSLIPVPIGTVVSYGGAIEDLTVEWLLCNGQAVSRTTYADLFAVLDNEYGTGDGSTTFNVPDFVTSNRFPRGATNNAGRGLTGGESTHVLTTAEMPSHSHSHLHTYPDSFAGGSGGRATGVGAVGNTNTSTDATLTGGGATHENKPPFLDIHFIIKAL